MRRVRGPSLPARLVFLSQSLGRAAHLCEALGVRAGAHAAFLWLFDLGQNVPDLPLSQLDDRGEMRMVWINLKAALVQHMNVM